MSSHLSQHLLQQIYVLPSMHSGCARQILKGNLQFKVFRSLHHCATLHGLAKKINVGHGAPASDMHFTRLSLRLSLRQSPLQSLCLFLCLSISRCGVCQKAELTWAISLPAVQGVTTLKLISLVKFYVYVM